MLVSSSLCSGCCFYLFIIYLLSDFLVSGLALWFYKVNSLSTELHAYQVPSLYKHLLRIENKASPVPESKSLARVLRRAKLDCLKQQQQKPK